MGSLISLTLLRAAGRLRAEAWRVLSLALIVLALPGTLPAHAVVRPAVSAATTTTRTAVTSRTAAAPRGAVRPVRDTAPVLDAVDRIALGAPVTLLTPVARPSSELDSAVPVSLEILVRTAIENNLTLLTGRLRDRTAAAGVQGAEAVFDPNLTVSVNHALTEQNTFGTVPTTWSRSTRSDAGVAGTLPTSTQYDVGISSTRSSTTPSTGTLAHSYDNALTWNLTQPLLKGAGPWMATARVRIAELAQASTREQVARLAERTVADVENAYWQLGQAEESLRVSEKSRDLAASLVRRNTTMLRLEIIAELDLVAAMQSLAGREADVVRARKQRQDAQEALLFLVYGERALAEVRLSGLTIATDPTAGAAQISGFGAGTSAEVLPAEVAAEQSLLRRPDIRAARRDIEQSEASLRVARNAVLPDVSVTGGWSDGGVASEMLTTRYARGPGESSRLQWTAGVAVSVPIGLNAAQADREKALVDLEAKRFALATAVNSVQSEVRQAVRAVEAARARQANTEEAARLAERQLTGETRKLELGLIDSYRLLQVENDVRSARLTAAQARYELLGALTSYRLAVGSVSGTLLDPVRPER